MNGLNRAGSNLYATNISLTKQTFFFQKVHRLLLFNTRKEASFHFFDTKNERLAGHFKKNQTKFSAGFKISLSIGPYQGGLSQGIPFCEPQQLICLRGGKNPSEPVLDHQEAASGRPKDLRKQR